MHSRVPVEHLPREKAWPFAVAMPRPSSAKAGTVAVCNEARMTLLSLPSMATHMLIERKRCGVIVKPYVDFKSRVSAVT